MIGGRLDSMTITFGATKKPRKKPELGDTRIYKGRKQVRKYDLVHDAGGRVIGTRVAHGRPCYVWVDVEEGK